MSNSVNPIENNGHCNTLGTRAGTRVDLRETAETSQNSSPVQPGLREVANNTQTEKIEHEVKVQFTREFVDAGAPDSRPESLSPAGSFRNRLASTLSNKGSPVPFPLPQTPLRAVDTSYVNSDIPGLEDLITACESIHLGDKIDSEESDARSKKFNPVINETMAKKLELLRLAVLQLESELEKERKEFEKQRMSYKKLEEELAQEMQKNNEMTLVMDEYEKSLSRQMTDRETERARFAQERARLQEELQTANHHLGNTEAAFNDVHSKYERMKCVVSAYQSNEYVLKESVQENVETIKTLEARYEQLKNHAMSQLEKANLELETIRKQHETETARSRAMIREAELKSNLLAQILEQKSNERKELEAIFDKVIGRVGENPE